LAQNLLKVNRNPPRLLPFAIMAETAPERAAVRALARSRPTHKNELSLTPRNKLSFSTLTFAGASIDGDQTMRSLLIALSAIILAGLAAPAGAEEYILNCRLLTTDNWLYRQHCNAANYSRLAVPETVMVEEDWTHPKKKKHAYSKKLKNNKKHAYLKKRIYAKKHALLKKKEYLKKKLFWKLAYLEKKLQAEWRECKANPKCQLIVKRKLAKLYGSPAYAGLAPTGLVNSGTLSTTASSPLSGTTNTVGSVATTGGDTLSGTTNTAGNALSGTTNTVGNTATGATNTVGNTVSDVTNTVGGVLD
jgi:hypothetical protein